MSVSLQLIGFDLTNFRLSGISRQTVLIGSNQPKTL